MGGRSGWAKALTVAGCVLFLVGTLDPLEGSIAILAGAALGAAGAGMGRQSEGSAVFWSWTVGLLVVGVAALWGLSALGGVGGDTGRSYVWLLFCLPYPVGWLMALGGIVTLGVRSLRRQRGGPPHVVGRAGA